MNIEQCKEIQHHLEKALEVIPETNEPPVEERDYKYKIKVLEALTLIYEANAELSGKKEKLEP